MRRTYLILIATLCCATVAHANPIPTFTLTQGSVSVTSDVSGTSLSWGFSGPGGVFAGGGGTAGFGCFNGVLAADICDPGVAITSFGPNTGSAFGPGLGSTGTQAFFYGTGIFISGSAFTLPQPGAGTFTITLPVIFSGQLTACPLDIVYLDCASGPIGIFNVNGKGKATLTFSGATSLDPHWFMTSGTYTLNPVPEPTSFALLGTGVLGLFGKFVRRKR